MVSTSVEKPPAVAATLPAVLQLNGQRHDVRMHFGRPLAVAGRFDDTDLAHVLQEGFGLSVPQVLASRFDGGRAPERFQLLPAVQVGSLPRGIAHKGIEVIAASATRPSRHFEHIGHFNFMTWLQPRSIIGVLIAL